MKKFLSFFLILVLFYGCCDKLIPPLDPPDEELIYENCYLYDSNKDYSEEFCDYFFPEDFGLKGCDKEFQTLTNPPVKMCNIPCGFAGGDVFIKSAFLTYHKDDEYICELNQENTFKLFGPLTEKNVFDYLRFRYLRGYSQYDRDVTLSMDLPNISSYEDCDPEKELWEQEECKLFAPVETKGTIVKNGDILEVNVFMETDSGDAGIFYMNYLVNTSNGEVSLKNYTKIIYLLQIMY
ncbi:hypothetical protein KO465_02670 [Candidatus Micrarchaeota archaeon]|nr:hypothetical protein [Candidatus Micrarchaeota archaeon]